MNWILLFLTLEFSYMPNEAELLKDNFIVHESSYNMVFIPEIELFGLIHITGEADFKMLASFRSFKPVAINSIFDVYFEYNIFKIGYEHVCLHPIQPWGLLTTVEQEYNLATDKFYLRISTKKE